jgi:hypothetical protein
VLVRLCRVAFAIVKRESQRDVERAEREAIVAYILAARSLSID